ncbi:MAG: hypothetical protein APF80_08700 [Alphaproteobacteria bacterium BRH_c36]|nr:MAG: hypothetical protein APF80_08700 [Alphaproteobacteria bacterium BRH_c36]
MIKPHCKLSFVRLPDIPLDEIVAHMSAHRIAEHMPLLTPQWDRRTAAEFVTAKEACWLRDGLGHWAILCNDVYAGWGGFQKEGDEWDFGLVLKPDYFGLGSRIAKHALEFARADETIPFVTLLVPLSRRNLGGLRRLGATLIGEVEYESILFLKYRIGTQ